MAKENHTFSPLPEGARIISEKDGERIAEWNGITLVDTSKEKQAQQPIPTVEEAIKKIKIAKPKKMCLLALNLSAYQSAYPSFEHDF